MTCKNLPNSNNLGETALSPLRTPICFQNEKFN